MEGGRCWCIFCNHTFDVQKGIEELKVFSSTMFGLGLVMVLDAEPEQHIDETADGDGFLLKLHEPGEGSHPLFGSVNLPVGETTYVAITAKRIERMPGFLPDLCISDFPKSMDYADRSEKYELHACFEACQQKIISEVCECIVADLYNLTTWMPKPCPALPPVRNDSNVVCDPTELIRDSTLRQYYDVSKCGYICSTKMQNFPTEFFSECSRMCRPNCQETLYYHSTSRTKWLASLKNLYDREYLKANNATALVKVFVFFEHIEMEFLSSVPEMTYMEALVEVGGQMGNYLGLTALILFEICELTVRFFWILYKKHRQAAAESRADLTPSEQAFLQKTMRANNIEASELSDERKLLTNRLVSARRPVAFQHSVGRA